MPSIVLYLLKCSICLAMVWLFYQLLLRRLTFYMMNRWYLLGYALLSFLLPLVHIALPAEAEVPVAARVIHFIPVISGLPVAAGTKTTSMTGWDMLLCIVALGALLFSARLLIRWLSLRQMRKGATLIRDEAVSVYQVDQPIIPFSFGNAIYINPRLHSENEWEEIILHEYIHVRQKHTVDILLAELLCIVSWFNPFSWLIRHSIRQNLEFIADRQVLASGRDKKSYQYHLLKVIGEPRYQLANNFNFSSLKKRIIMMNRSKSARLHLVRFLFIVPLLGVLLVAFRDKMEFNGRDNEVPADHKRLPMAERNVVRRIRDTPPAGPGPELVSLRKNMPDSLRPMIVIDEVEADEAALKKLNPADIGFMDILKGLTHDFGPRAKGGVVLIFTKKYKDIRKNEVLLKDGTRVRLAVAEPQPSVGPANNRPAETVDTIHGNKGRLSGVSDYYIDSVRVGNTIYSGHVTGLVFTDTTKPAENDNSMEWLKKAVIIVDNVETPYAEFKLEPNRIESISILKDKSATAIYGEKGKNGVIIIKTKKPGSKVQATLTIDSGGGDKTTMKADSINFKPIVGEHGNHQ